MHELNRNLAHRAQAKLPEATWQYLNRGAGKGIAVAANETAWETIQLLPRLFRLGRTEPSPGTTVLGTPLTLPVMTAPNGRATHFHPQGEAELLRGVASAGTIAVLGSSVAPWLADLRIASPAGERWSQLYFSSDRAVLENNIAAATQAGCTALVLTVDLLPSPLTTSPPPPPAAPWQRAASTSRQPPDFVAATADDLAWLCSNSPLPVIVKGVLASSDARICADCGAAAVIVSNHGGNQLDTAVPTAIALPEIVTSVGERIDVYVDGGIRTGEDVFKAIALGAKATLVGRPASVALAAGGAEVLTAYLNALSADFKRVMALCGASCVADINRAMVRV